MTDSSSSSSMHRADSALHDHDDTSSNSSAPASNDSLDSMESSATGSSSFASSVPVSSLSAEEVSALCQQAAGIGGGQDVVGCIVNELITARLLTPCVQFMQQLASIVFRASVGVAACSLLLMFLSRGQDLTRLPAAFLSADSFVSVSFKTSAFYLVHSIVTPMFMKPTLSEQEKAAVGRRSALVLLAYEIVAFSLIAFRYRQLSSTAAMAAAAAASSQPLTSCAECYYVWILRFASVVMCAHTLLIAAIVGIGAGVLARAENQDMVTSVREACNARLASMPSACQIIGRVCTTVCAPAVCSSSSAASASSASKCPFAAFASASNAKCPFSGASASTAAAESASATVAPVASSSSAAPAGACPFRTASCFAVKAQMVLSCAGACAVAALHKFVQRMQHAPELNASPSEQRRVAEQHHRNQPLSPVPEVSTPASPAAPTPSAASSSIVEATVASPAPPVAAAASSPEPESLVAASAAPVSDSTAAAPSASSVSPDEEDGFEFIEKSEQ